MQAHICEPRAVTAHDIRFKRYAAHNRKNATTHAFTSIAHFTTLAIYRRTLLCGFHAHHLTRTHYNARPHALRSTFNPHCDSKQTTHFTDPPRFTPPPSTPRTWTLPKNQNILGRIAREAYKCLFCSVYAKIAR